MAIGIGSIVSPAVNSVLSPSTNSLGPVVQGPTFGVSESAASPFTILWDNGQRVAAIPTLSLDEITAADLTVREAFIGRRVTVNTPSGQNNWGICVCVSAYKRAGNSVLLLQNAQGEYFIEVLSSECTAVA